MKTEGSERVGFESRAEMALNSYDIMTPGGSRDQMVYFIANAIESAVRAERNRCERLARLSQESASGAPASLADAIKNGVKPPSR
jgi:hypothetical protein